MTEATRNRCIGAVCTFLVHAALLLLLWFVVIGSEPVNNEAGGGIWVQLGNIDEASGTFEPYQEMVATTPRIEKPAPQEESLITQEEEATVAIPEEKKKTEPKKEVQSPPVEPERDSRIDDRLKSAFGKGVASSGSRGEAEKGTGVQGNPFGSSSSGELHGVGGYGGYSLGGRGLLGGLPRPQYDSSNDAGTIVVDITVDSRGKVISARVRVSGSEGSAASNMNLRNSAIAAAKQASFEASPTADNQQGYIVYYFKQQ